LSSVSGASYNLGIGDGSLQNMGSSGTFNVALGYSSLGALTSGSNNVSIGYESGQEASTSINCVFVGYQAGYGGFPYNGSNSNVIVIGYKAEPSTNSVTHEITLGNSSISTLRCAVTTITSLSDQRDKTNIQPMPSVLSFIASLNPVRFDWWTRDGAKIGVPDYGFIAQELQQAQASTGFDWAQLVYESNPEKLEASPGKLIPILVKAIQELAAKVAALEASA
jgi:hypothetical protein